jgi:hypothetical protein
VYIGIEPRPWFPRLSECPGWDLNPHCPEKSVGFADRSVCQFHHPGTSFEIPKGKTLLTPFAISNALLVLHQSYKANNRYSLRISGTKCGPVRIPWYFGMEAPYLVRHRHGSLLYPVRPVAREAHRSPFSMRRRERGRRLWTPNIHSASVGSLEASYG